MLKKFVALEISLYFCIRFRENFSGFNAPSFFSDRVGKSSLKGLHTRQRSSTRSGARHFWFGRRVEIRTVNDLTQVPRRPFFRARGFFFCSFSGYASPGLESDSFPFGETQI